MSNKIKLCVIDPITKGIEHASFNYHFINKISNISFISDYFLIIDEKQIKCPPFQGNIFNKFKKIMLLRGKRESTLLFITLRRIIDHLKIVFNILKYKNNTIVFIAADNYFTPLSIALIKLLLRVKIFVVFHNNVEHYFSQKNCLKKLIIKKIWKFALKRLGCEIIILAEFLKNNMPFIPIETRILFVKHPIFLETHKKIIDKDKIEKETDFIFIGNHAYLAFQSGFLKKFIGYVHSFWERNKTAIVALPDSIYKKIGTKSVFLKSFPDYPAFDTYLYLINKSRFLVIPNISGSRMSASGLLADTIAIGAPIVAPRKGAFLEHMDSQDRRFYYENESDLKSIIKEISCIDEYEYNKISKNIIEYGLKKANNNDLKVFEDRLLDLHK